MDNEGEEFIRDYLDLPLPPSREGSQFRSRGVARNSILAMDPRPSRPN